MIHFHGTPVSGSAKEAISFLSGRHALVSFAHPRDIEVASEVCQSFCLDNGAYSQWRSGGTHDVQGFRLWAQKWIDHPACDFAIIPDVIDGSADENKRMVDDWEGKHWQWAPVWHLHEPLSFLLQYALKFRVVCLGSSGQWNSPGTPQWWERIAKAMETVCVNGRPICKLHGLRMLDPRIFEALPLYSADSTNAAVNAGSLSRFGSYIPPSAGLRASIIASRIETTQAAAIWRGSYTEELF